MTWSIQHVLNRLSSPRIGELPAPEYVPDPGTTTFNRLGLAVESMKRHMTDEGWQLFAGLEHAGYLLCGADLHVDETDVNNLLRRFNPDTVVMQDKREWEGLTADKSRDLRMRFRNVDALHKRSDIFKVTVLKDSHQNPSYHRESAEEISCHAWIVYYHPRIVKHLAPFVRPQHLVRVYHSLDSAAVPEFYDHRVGALLSGAVSVAYPLRKQLVRQINMLPETEHVPHPGYHRKGCCTPAYLKLLSRFKVAICTASVYGYTLRRIFEATACGCAVLTDLPADERLPLIDGNLVRVRGEATVNHVASVLRQMLVDYNPDKQQHYAELAQRYYDYHNSGQRLAQAIDDLRLNYNASKGNKSC